MKILKKKEREEDFLGSLPQCLRMCRMIEPAGSLNMSLWKEEDPAGSVNVTLWRRRKKRRVRENLRKNPGMF